MTDVAVVTGAGRGIGRAVATRLGGHGCDVVVADVDEQAGKRTAAELGERAHALPDDVRVAEAHGAVARPAAALGDLGIWVNNAGVLRAGMLWDHDGDVIDAMVEVNLVGVVHGTRAALAVVPAMRWLAAWDERNRRRRAGRDPALLD